MIQTAGWPQPQPSFIKLNERCIVFVSQLALLRQEPKMYIGQIVGLVNLVVGIGIGFGAWQMYAGNQRKLAKWSKTVGVVMAFKSRSTGGISSTDNANVLHPVIEYQTDSGSTISFESKLGSSSWKFDVGSEVEIIVNPHNPKDAEIKGFGAQTFIPIAMGAISGMMILSAPLTFLFF